MTREVVGYLPGTGLVKVVLESGRIASLEVTRSAPGWEPDLAMAGVLLPGLVDLQLNGFAGIDFNDPALTADEVLGVSERLWAHGVVAFAPTTITGPLEAIEHALTTFDAARARTSDARAAGVLGAHLEGPWISAEDGARGAHPAEHARAGSRSEIERLAAVGRVDLVTVAPEVPGVLALVEAAVARRIQVSIGHSAAAPSDVGAGVRAGASLSTHLGNGVVTPLSRHPNLVWEQLASDELTAMFIADLHHVDVTTLRAMIRAKGSHRVILVSDGTSLSGAAPGRYTTRIGGEVELAPDGRLSVAGTPYLAGSATSLEVCLANVLANGLLPARAALTAASARPADVIARTGNPAPSGRLRPGARADLVVARWEQVSGSFHPEVTYLAGDPVWRAG